MSEFKGYWLAIFREAFSEALSEAHIETPMRMFLAIAGGILGLVLLYLIGDEKAAHAEIMLKLAIMAIIVFTFPFILAWKVARAPVNRDMALRDVIAGLQKQAADKKHLLSVNETIGSFWSEGEDLWSRSGTGEGLELAAAKAEWTLKVERYLSEVNLLDEAVGFKTIPDFRGKLGKLRKIWMRAAGRAR